MHYRWPLFLSILFGFVITGIKGMDLKWTGKMFDDLPQKNESRLTTQYIGNNLGGIIPLEINIQSNKKISTWSQPASIKKLEQILNQIKKSKVVSGSMSLVDFLKVADPKFKIPQSKAQMSEIFLVYGMSSENPLSSFVTPNQDGTRILLKLKDAPADQIMKLKENIGEMILNKFPDHKVSFGGIGATLHPLNNDLSKDLMWGFFHALLGIVILLTFVFKSLRWALVSVIPNLIPPVVLLGALAITQTPIKPGIAIIFAISLGIAFDNTIYILGRLKRMMNQKNVSQLPIQELLNHEFSACFISGLSLISGFSIFLFSQFNVNQVFGSFMLLSVVAGLVGDLVLLPIVLKMFPRLLLDGNHDKIESGILTNKGRSMIQTVSVFLILITLSLLTSSSVSHASENASSILNKIKNMSTPKDETAILEMTISEPDGSKKIRNLTIMRKNSDAQKALVKIQSPSDLKGVALLSISNGESEDQWLYLPSAKKARRIVGSGKSGKFLDSELSYEDLSPSTYSLYTNQISPTSKSKNKKLTIIESKAKPNVETTFKKIRTYVDSKLNRIEKVEYFDPSGKLVKTMSFSKYKKLENKYWRAGQIKIENHQLKRGTTLELKSVNLKKLDDDQFTTSALE
jgi:outer membrane lipoprotein-sorting protein